MMCIGCETWFALFFSIIESVRFIEANGKSICVSRTFCCYLRTEFSFRFTVASTTCPFSFSQPNFSIWMRNTQKQLFISSDFLFWLIRWFFFNFSHWLNAVADRPKPEHVHGIKIIGIGQSTQRWWILKMIEATYKSVSIFYLFHTSVWVWFQIGCISPICFSILFFVPQHRHSMLMAAAAATTTK